MSKYEQSFEL